MNERLSQSSIPVQETPDFHTALNEYGRILGVANVSPTDIENTKMRILERNKTRQEGNTFINLVNELGRGLNLP